MVATLFQFEKSVNCIKVKTIITGIMLSTEIKAKTKMLVISNIFKYSSRPSVLSPPTCGRVMIAFVQQLTRKLPEVQTPVALWTK